MKRTPHSAARQPAFRCPTARLLPQVDTGPTPALSCLHDSAARSPAQFDMDMVRRLAPWVLAPLLALRLTMLMFYTRGNVLRLPAAMTGLDWLAAVLLAGWAIWHFAVAGRKQSLDPTLVSSFVRFWNEWRRTGMAVTGVALDGVNWTVRTSTDQARGKDGRRAIVVEPPKCPKCGSGMTEAKAGKDWYRDCTSAACRNRVLSRSSFAQTQGLLHAASAEAWKLTAPA
jgi:hypothetical protein